MSVEDVCELGSLLQCGDKEKQVFERKLIELDGAIQTQDRRLNHEVEAEQWARNEQDNLLEYAVNASNDFEIASSVVSQVHEDTVSTKHLSRILERVNAYIVLRNDLAEDIGSVRNEIGRLVAASQRVGDYKSRGISAEITDATNLIASNKAIDDKRRHSLMEIETELLQKATKIDEMLITGAAGISNLFSNLDQGKELAHIKINDLERNAASERMEANITLTSLQAAKATSSTHIDEIILHRDGIAAQGLHVVSSTANDEALLRSTQEESSSLSRNLDASYEAEHDTAKELEEAKKQLIELDKFASDNTDELDRIRRAQAFEVMREEAFLKSQSGNTGSAQQICTEAEKLRASLDLVRADIEQVKQQIATDSGIGSDAVLHEKIQQLSATKITYQTRSATAHSRIEVCEQQDGALEERIVTAREMKDVAGEERNALEKVRMTLLTEHEKTEGILKDLSDQIKTYAPASDRERAFESLNAQSAALLDSQQSLDTEEIAVKEHAQRVLSAAKAHNEEVQAFNTEKEKSYELSEKNRRLRLSRQEKLAESDRALKVYQDDLKREDDKFKEAIKAAEESARLTEEKLVATMNQVIEVGLQMVANRNRHREEVKKIEACTKLIDTEKEDLLAALAEAIDSGSGGTIQPPPTSQRATSSKHQSPRKNTNPGHRNSHQGGRTPILAPDAWSSSSPATNLPQQPSDNEEGDEVEDPEAEVATQPQRRHSLHEEPSQKQDEGKDALLRRKTFGMTVSAVDEPNMTKKKGRPPKVVEADKTRPVSTSEASGKVRPGARMRAAVKGPGPSAATDRGEVWNKENDPDEINVPRVTNARQNKRKF